MAKKKSTKIKRVLTLTVLYESESMSQAEMLDESKRLLENLVYRATNEGLLSGNTDMTVDEYDYRFESSIGDV